MLPDKPAVAVKYRAGGTLGKIVLNGLPLTIKLHVLFAGVGPFPERFNCTNLPVIS